MPVATKRPKLTPERLARMFTAEHITSAWERLRSQGWVSVPQLA
jgi:hypothetical protein